MQIKITEKNGNVTTIADVVNIEVAEAEPVSDPGFVEDPNLTITPDDGHDPRASNG